MNRRSFIRGALALPLIPKAEAKRIVEKALAPPIAFKSDAFSMKFIRSFDPYERRWIDRMDVLYGFGTVK